MDRKHIKTSDLNKIFNNASFILIARIIEIVFNLVSIALIARYLGPKGFGEFAFIMALVSTALFITGFALDQVIIKESAIDKSKAGVLLGIALMNRFVFALLSVAIFFLITLFFSFEASQYLITAVYIAFFFETINALANIYIANFKSLERMEYDTIITAIGSFISMFFVLAVVNYHLGFLYVIYAIGAGKSVRLLLCIYLSITKFIMPEFSLNLTEHLSLLKKSVAVGIAIIFRFVSLKVDVFVLQILRSSADVGIFNVSHRFLMAIQVLPYSIVQALFPILSRLGKESLESLASFYKATFKLLFIASIPITVIVLVFSEFLIVLILGKDFLAAILPLQILSLSVPLLFVLSLATWTLFCIDKQKIITFTTGACLLINLALDLALIPQHGPIGAAIATLSAYIFLSASTTYYLYKEIRALPSISILFKISVCGAVMCMFMYFFRDWEPVLIAFLGFFIYSFLIYILRCFNIKEIKAFKEIMSSKIASLRNQ